ncbi:MAG: tRNA (N6-threonylcarbamoyladenosine(37)-N6)-methyltransferase TrmO [Promethearchaeota archaeon]|nr:MAG: tRNA (N6-threonylcarbamoyladenosine(37)-N6)-methyltransferase TrmO [Candidatus Lokiarchaeota archaeon]
MKFKTIGYIESPFKKKDEVPRQFFKSNYKGKIEIFEQYREALSDLDGFSYIYVLYLFHKNKGYRLKIKPFFGYNERGLFSTRYPARPNPIGLSIYQLLGIEDNILHVKGVDVLSGTPVLDIKPYVDVFDHISDKNMKRGWLQEYFKNKNKNEIEFHR